MTETKARSHKKKDCENSVAIIGPGIEHLLHCGRGLHAGDDHEAVLQLDPEKPGTKITWHGSDRRNYTGKYTRCSARCWLPANHHGAHVVDGVVA